MISDKILPVEEIVHEKEFTGRTEILRDLEDWVEQIGRVGASSRSIIAHWRMGKTVLLDRLVNNIFFKKDYKVAPFYINFKREEITLRRFLHYYAREFFRQYIAYCLQDPILYRKQDNSLEELLEIQSDNKAVIIAQQEISSFLKRYNNKDYDDVRNHWDDFIKIPEKIASFSGIKAVVIIDEFQDMKFYVYDLDEAGLIELKDKNKGKPSYGAVDLTATYDRQAESRKAPMLVSGSAVTLIFRTVMGGPLGGRFQLQYLRPLSIPDGATLITKLVNLYLVGEEITPENAIYASTQVNGHPYYLYCLATSKYPDKSFASKNSIKELIDYEIKAGNIYGFWQTHFEDNKEYINNDNEEKIGKKILYYFARYNDQEVQIEEIARDINISPKLVESKIEKLYLADLVYKTEGRYYGFNNICLMRYIKFIYEKNIKVDKKIDLEMKVNSTF